ncbi:MAG: NAD-dependent protein deacylase [Oscillospiraceae bacterium]|nr:NAD-dependent protein deacylase [Oscillospiraceae bacterium]
MQSIAALNSLVKNSARIVFFGGAGVSVPSGIPDFRSETGLYRQKQRYGHSAEVMLSHDYFFARTETFYRFYRECMLYPDARPNAAHRKLAQLEKAGKLTAVVTQNIDGLHQMAGSKNVLELHGSVHRNHCLGCGRYHSLADLLAAGDVPRCSVCGGLLKPDVVLYGEQLDDDTVDAAIDAIAACDLLIVGGTSLSVWPAAGLIRYLKKGAKLAIVNLSPTEADAAADLVVCESIEKVFEQIEA